MGAWKIHLKVGRTVSKRFEGVSGFRVVLQRALCGKVDFLDLFVDCKLERSVLRVLLLECEGI